MKFKVKRGHVKGRKLLWVETCLDKKKKVGKSRRTFRQIRGGKKKKKAGDKGFPGGSGGKHSAYNAGDLGSIPGLGRSPGGGNGNPLQYPCLGNPMNRDAGWATVHEVTKESDMTERLTHKEGESK